MKLARFKSDGQIKIGVVRDTAILSLTDRVPGVGADMIAVIERWVELFDQIGSLPPVVDYRLEEVILEAPIGRPGKIMGLGLNYRDHIEEAKLEVPTFPMWFTKAPTSINSPNGPIEVPRISETLDYEAELVFIVGRRCKHVAPDRAHDAIFGYCAGNDVSVREWQRRTSQVTLGKSFDTSAPFGPFIVTSDEIDSGNLSIRCLVNGEVRQSSNTRHMVFSCAAQLADLSSAMTMEPGDIVFTGTPGGVGALMSPKTWLRAGDVVRVEIEGIGFIENVVVDERPPSSP